MIVQKQIVEELKELTIFKKESKKKYQIIIDNLKQNDDFKYKNILDKNFEKIFDNIATLMEHERYSQNNVEFLSQGLFVIY